MMQFAGWIRLGILGAAVCSYVTTAQADLRVFASGGYAKLTSTDSDSTSDDVLTGLEGKLAGHYDVLSPIPGLAIYAGPEVRSGSYTNEQTTDGVSVKSTMDKTLAGVEAGVSFGLIPLLTLQAGFNYNIPLSTKVEAKSAFVSVSAKGTSGSETGVTLRGLITPFPLIRLGVEYSMGSGKDKFENVPDEAKYDFWAARGVVGIAL